MSLIQLLKFSTWEHDFSKCLVLKRLVSKQEQGLQLPLCIGPW